MTSPTRRRGTSAPAARAATASPVLPGWTTTPWSQRCRRSSGTSSATGQTRSHGLLAVGPRLFGLGVHDLEGRDVLVPFVEGGRRPRAPPGQAVQLPHLGDGVVAVRVHDVRPLVRVSGHVVLDHAVSGDPLDVGPRVEAVVEGADVDVVDVEE